jgi:Big-like domain-containing protein
VPVVATGSSNITGWSFSSYTHGDTTSGSGYTGNIFRVDTIGQPGYPTSVTVNATDSTGKKYTQSVSGVLTYYDGNCLRLCDPGVTIKSPQYFHDQPTKFTVDASVSQPQAAIDSMKVYLDGKVVATSTGPTIYATITATSGSHVLTVQAWDAKHALYRTQQTVNVD